MSRNKLIAALLLVLMLLPGMALGDDLIGADLLVPESANYETLTIEYGSYIKEVSASGYQVFVVEQNLAMEEGTAQLSKVHVMRNAEVKAGDVLVTFEKDGSRADLERMKLSLTRTQESFETGKLEREKQLKEMRKQQGSLTDAFEKKRMQIQIEQAQLTYEQYVYENEYSIKTQQKAIAEREEFFADSQIVAPFDGKITYVTSRNAGDSIRSGETLITIQAQDRYVIGMDNAGGNFRYGMDVVVALGPRNKKTYLDGRIIASGNILPNESKIDYALVEIFGTPTSSGLKNILVTGENIRLDNMLMIARKAITAEGGRSYVSILDGDMVQKRIISSGHTAAGSTWVVQGLTEGQEVIID